MRTIAPPAPAAEDLAGSRLVLRDGTVAAVRPSVPADGPSLRQFFHELSPASRRSRFFGTGEPPDSLIAQLADSSDRSRGLTLLALRDIDGEERVVAVASYFAVTDSAAEVAFAVDDRFQGKGLSTLLLERLAIEAAAHGFQGFHATMLAENAAMREVFRASGFEIRSQSGGGTIEVQLALVASSEGVAAAERRRQEATALSLRALIAPRTIAIVGASRQPAKMGSRIFQHLRAAGFTGPIYPVHPTAEAIDGVPTVRSARDLPAGVDLAVLAVPPEHVLSVADDCAAAGVRSLVVITAGFAEAGTDGRTLQQALVEAARRHGMRMIGPNCMGLVNTDPAIRLNASISPLVPPVGSVALSSQSGALGIAILGLAEERQVGLSSFVSIGNKADVSSNDLLEYWESDPATRVVLLYLESFGNPRRFSRVARRVGRTKPIVALKAGRTAAGSRAAGSHTAALAARDVAVDALFRQSGVIRAETVDEMFDIAACLSAQTLPTGNRVAVVTNAGGPGILAVDACEAAGLRVAEWSAATRDSLASFLPPTASLGNPIDMVASAGPEAYRRTVETAIAAPEVDAAIVIYTPIDPAYTPETLEAIEQGIAAARAAGCDKPVLACVMSQAVGRRPLRVGDERVPLYAFPENAVRALGKVAAYAKWRSEPAGLFWGFDDLHLDQARAICRTAAAAGGGWLSDRDTWGVLHAFGLPAAVSTLARTADEAIAAAGVIGFPVALKLASSAVSHKTELGGVRLSLSTPQEVRRAFAEIVGQARRVVAEDAVDGVVVQPMVGGGIETLVGIAHDATFGPLVAFGMGGITVEVLGDVGFRVAPLTDRDADNLLRGIRGFRLLEGFRGRPAADLEALRDVILRVSRLAEELPEVLELDLNPVIALAPGMGCRVVDARIRVAAKVS